MLWPTNPQAATATAHTTPQPNASADRAAADWLLTMAQLYPPISEYSISACRRARVRPSDHRDTRFVDAKLTLIVRRTVSVRSWTRSPGVPPRPLFCRSDGR